MQTENLIRAVVDLFWQCIVFVSYVINWCHQCPSKCQQGQGRRIKNSRWFSKIILSCCGSSRIPIKCLVDANCRCWWRWSMSTLDKWLPMSLLYSAATCFGSTCQRMSGILLCRLHLQTQKLSWWLHTWGQIARGRHENHILVQIPCFTLGSTSFCCPVKSGWSILVKKACCHFGGLWTTYCHIGGHWLDNMLPGSEKLLARRSALGSRIFIHDLHVDDWNSKYLHDFHSH